MATTLSRRALFNASSGLAVVATLGPLPRAVLAASLAASPAVSPAAPAAAAIRLAANENPYGPGESARQAIRDTLPEGWKYAMGEELELRKLIAEREGVTPQHVIIGDGSTEVLRLAALANGLAKGAFLSSAPTFSMVREYSRELGAAVEDVPLDADMRFDLSAMRGKITNATRLIYLCNPNNPTGTLVPGAAVRDFVASAPKEALVIVDEAYLDLDLGGDFAAQTALPRVLAGDNVLVTRTFSKLHGMAGLRIGYGLARPDIISRLEKLRISMLGIVVLRAAIASYRDTTFQAFSRAKIREGRGITDAVLKELGLQHTESRANFVFFDTGKPFREFSEAMQRRGIMIGRPFPPFTSWARVSMGTVEQMRVFADAAREHFRAA